MLFKYAFLVVGLFVVFLNAHEGSSPANILASGNNKFVLPALIQNFYKKYPDARVMVQYGSTGDLAHSIIQGVGYDIFLGADMEYPQKVYEAKKALNPPKVYARGALILFIQGDKTLAQKKLAILKSKKIKDITIANKETAPYGKAAIEVLKNADLLKSLQAKIHYARDVSTAITNVIWYDDAGFLSKSALESFPLSYREEGVNWIEIDQNLYTPIMQGYVVSKNGSKNKNALLFMDFLLSDEGRKIYEYFGYK